MLALRVLSRVEQVRAYADLSLHAALARSQLAPADRALATELVYGTLRWRGRLDFLLCGVSDRTIDDLDPLVRATLRVGAYQLVFSDRIPASAAVDESVRCVRAAGAPRASGFVNAVLRRLATEHDAMAFPALASDPVGHLVHALSIPAWLAERWVAEYGGAEAAALAEGLNRVPPRTVRANRLRGSRDALLAELRERHPTAAASRLAPDGIVLGDRGDPGLDSAFREGRFTVQDEASQLVVALLDPQEGERVLDACAAPGAKASAMAERVGSAGRVIALDRHERRLGLLLRDAASPRPRQRGRRDARRHPAAAGAARGRRLRPHPGGRPLLRSRRPAPQPRRPLAHPARGSAAAGRAAACDPGATSPAPPRSGGALVYSTCTLLREENDAVVEDFLRAHPGFRLVPGAELPGGGAARGRRCGLRPALPPPPRHRRLLRRAPRAPRVSAQRVVIAPSILSADFARLGEEVRAVEEAGADWIHVDVMDGRFVPNLTLGPVVVEAVKRSTSLPLDVHLMIVEPERYVDDFVRAGAATVGVQAEACVHLHRTVAQIKEAGARASVVLNPATAPEALEYVLPDIDQVLVMTVNPGFGGQHFIESMLDKISLLRRWIDERGLAVRLEVDGGIAPATVGRASAAGADTFVAGTAVFGAGDYGKAIRELRETAERAARAPHARSTG